jgi:tRNA (guanine-N7-)-methyltransferase
VKPKDLKPPFEWESPFVTIENGVLYAYGDPRNFVFPGFEVLFGNAHPVCIEYCSGNGDWIVEQALKYPEKNWVAVEKLHNRVKKIWAKRENNGIKNLFIVCGEGEHVTAKYFADDSVEHVFVNFPDPWPKKKHAKYRIVNPNFAAEMRRILIEKGAVTLVTDDIPYSEQMIWVMQREFDSRFPEPYFVENYEQYGATSYFEKLWREKGCKIRYHEFVGC